MPKYASSNRAVGRGIVPRLNTVQRAHMSQANWTLGVKCAWALNGLPTSDGFPELNVGHQQQSNRFWGREGGG